MKEKYDVPIAPESEFVSYMMEQMSQFGLTLYRRASKDFTCIMRAWLKQINI